MDTFRYGVFKLGQTWALTDEDGGRCRFARREVAIAALQAVIAIHRASRASVVVVTLQGHNGQLRNLVTPGDDLALEEEANRSAWGAPFEVERPSPAAFHLHAANEENG